jgi:hypothetical protein
MDVRIDVVSRIHQPLVFVEVVELRASLVPLQQSEPMRNERMTRHCNAEFITDAVLLYVDVERAIICV